LHERRLTMKSEAVQEAEFVVGAVAVALLVAPGAVLPCEASTFIDDLPPESGPEEELGSGSMEGRQKWHADATAPRRSSPN
jgi:hypothetical protein